MENIFEIQDKTGRKICLTKRQWKHIRKKHPEVDAIEELEKTIKNPNRITNDFFDEAVAHYYKYFKYKKSPWKYLFILVKYLNGKGFVITAYLEKNIKWKTKHMKFFIMKRPTF